jgi:hypothetical protein
MKPKIVLILVGVILEKQQEKYLKIDIKIIKYKIITILI